MIRNLRLPSLILVAAVSCPTANAQSTISYTAIASSYTQNFDTLPNAGTFAFTGPGPFDLSAPPVSGANMTGWSFLKTGGTGPNALFVVNNGASNSGATYSYGATGDPDRALGSLSSGTTISAFGAVFVNNTGQTLNSFTLGYTGEQWRRGSAGANSLSFTYGIGNPDLATGTFLPSAALTFTAPNIAGMNVALDGNAAGNNLPVNNTVTGFNWAPGQTLVIRWDDTNDTGNDDGLGIDNLSFSATSVAIRNLIWTPPPIVWNATNQNWSIAGVGPTAFQPGDIVNFTDSGLAQGSNVSIDPTGVAPLAVNVSNTTGVYTFSGGPIQGPTTTLTKTGAGTLVLSSTLNSYGGGTNLNGGTIIADNDGNFGDQAAALNFNGGTLKVDPQTTLLAINRGVTVASGGATLDTSARTLTFSSANFQGAGDLTIVGGGTVQQTVGNGFGNLNGSVNVTGANTRLILNAGNAISASSVIVIGGGAVVDDTLGDGETMAGLSGQGTYIGPNLAAPTVVGITATGRFDGMITAGNNGVPGPDPTTRRLNFSASFTAANGLFTLTNPASDFAGTVFVGNGTLSTPSLPNAGIPSPLGLGTDGVAPVPIIIGAGTITGTLQYTGPSTETDRIITLGTNARGGSIEVANPNTNLMLFGVISGGGTVPGSGLTKTGAGALTLNVANSYTGGTTVNAGTLLVNTQGASGTGTGDVTVNAGGTLGGSGNIGGNVTLNESASLGPGVSPGRLTIGGAITMSAGSNFVTELNGLLPAVEYDQMAVGGNVAINGSLLLASSNAGNLGGQTLQIITYGSITGGSQFAVLPEGAQFVMFSSGLPAATPFYLGTVSYGLVMPGAVTLQFAATPVPEPVHILLLSAGALGLWRWRRKRAFENWRA